MKTEIASSYQVYDYVSQLDLNQVSFLLIMVTYFARAKSVIL